MNREEIKAHIESTAAEANSTPAQIITIMQGELARLGDEASLDILCELKMEYR
jgi:hypothetical protein